MIHQRQGITLIESIIYVALIAVVLTGVVSLALNMIDLKARHLAMRDVIAAGSWANSAVADNIRGAESIVSPGPGLASTSLELLFPGGTSRKIYLKSGGLWLAEDSGAGQLLLPGYIKASNAFFGRSSAATRIDNINYTLDIGTDKSGAYGFSISLNSSVSTRQ